MRQEGRSSSAGYGAGKKQAEGETSPRQRAIARRLRRWFEKSPRRVDGRHHEKSLLQRCLNAVRAVGRDDATQIERPVNLVATQKILTCAADAAADGKSSMIELFMLSANDDMGRPQARMFQVLGLCISSSRGAHFTHDPWIVALSYIVAAIGSFAAFDMTERLNTSRGRVSDLWLLGSATVLGGSIWSTHLIGIMAAHTLFPLGYAPRMAALSLLLAVAACGVGLQLVRGQAPPSLRQLAGAGVVVGVGVAAMHYTGMAGVRLPGTLSYTPVLFVLSVAIAIGAATSAFWLSWNLVGVRHRALAALVMGGAICGMHYVGMAATVIHFNPLISASVGLDRAPVTVAVAGTTIALLMLALLCDGVHRSLDAAVHREMTALLAANREMVRRLSTVGELRDGETGRHVLRLALVAERLAAQLGCEAAFSKLMRETAQLHDIGKIGVPDSILLKPGPLTAEEWQVMQSHAEMGHRILGGSGLPLLDLAAEIALTHHEKWDGTGYPRGLKGEEIPLSGRIVAVADVFDALLSKRPYKTAWPVARVEAYLRYQAGRHFDPNVVAAFLDDLTAMVAIQADKTNGAVTFAEPAHDPTVHRMRTDTAGAVRVTPAIACG